MMNNKYLSQDIGMFLKKARKDKSLTAAQLGCLVHLSQQQVSRYELGITKINIEMLDVFLTVLDKDWADFFFSVMACHSEDIKWTMESHY